jgi:hypothetical protein
MPVQDHVSNATSGEAGADARAIAARAVAAWTGIDKALSPIVGRQGVAALYKRSLHLTAAAYPWLATASEGACEPGDFSALQSAIEQQAVAQASAAQNSALDKFREMLTNLIGESLTERLLQPVWIHFANGDDALEKS